MNFSNIVNGEQKSIDDAFRIAENQDGVTPVQLCKCVLPSHYATPR